MNIFEEEIIEFMELLNQNNVRYILVGGLAVNYYGHSRATGDIDLWLEDSKDNRTHLVNKLTAFGIAGAETFMTLPIVAGYAEIVLNNGVYLDFMTNLVALKQDRFEECYQLSEKFLLSDNTAVNVLHINKLIEEKTKSGRAKDLYDVEHLKKSLNGPRK